MTIEQEMVIMNAKDLEEYQAKHDVKVPIPQVQFFSAKVPEDEYYKAAIKAIENKNARLRKENEELRNMVEELKGERNYYKELQDSTRLKVEDKVERRFKEYQERIDKLEKALIEAAIR